MRDCIHSEYAIQVRDKLESSYDAVWHHRQQVLQHQKDNYDKKVPGNSYTEGALVVTQPCGSIWTISEVPSAMDWTFQIDTTKRTYRIQGTTGQKKRLVVHIDWLKLYCQCQDPHPDTELTDTLPSHQLASDSENTTSNFGDQLQIVDDDQDTVPVERTQVPSCQQRPPKRLLHNVKH